MTGLPYSVTYRPSHGILAHRQDRNRDRRRLRYVFQLMFSTTLSLLTYQAGINLSFAKLLLSKRCNVLIADLALRPEAQELVSKYSNTSQASAKAVFQMTDLRDWNHLERMFHVATDAFGDIDVVCPGAGVYEPVWGSTYIRPFQLF